jgi:hypothetical protein
MSGMMDAVQSIGYLYDTFYLLCGRTLNSQQILTFQKSRLSTQNTQIQPTLHQQYRECRYITDNSDYSPVCIACIMYLGLSIDV